MRLVRQKEQSGRGRGKPGKGKLAAGALSAAVVATAIASGCASDTDGRAGAHGQQRQPAEAMRDYADVLRAKQAARAAAAKRWGLAQTPLAAPPAPAVKPRLTTRKGFEVAGQAELPPVFTTVPTKDKVVFLTVDDGAEKDPAFLRMMTDLKLPYTAFLSDYLVKEDYGYFKRMQRRGVVLNNHTLNHRYLPGLSYEGQRREICGMQDTIQKRYGKRPELFRPPYGNYNRDTLRAAKTCGVKAVPLWASEGFADHMEWREWDKDLHPGDIVLTHFRGREDWKGTMPDMVRTVLKTVTAKGYAVARLEDYL
ncbi:polysaccharide deacetylase family protein [Streptomyces aureoverticillatus]|uniref:polysaccharide deacetylase family protein n=1 Tax=Streptomyces aureoverticillatus TaxID=66871 RepID=UPI0013D95D41|nr:polysaccharide deacetylase family protein [Streptomyces aureoverticillatus]QIB44074.1 polysaccharide deacetylase family protein [Streptomyces aureoverticillatus]